MFKNLLRQLLMMLYLFFRWPFFLCAINGNKKYTLKENTLIISNHYSKFDPFFVQMMFFKKPIHFVTSIDMKQGLYTKFIGWLFNAIYLDFKNAYANVKDSIEHLKNGAIICIFPEGQINKSKYGIQDFKTAYLTMAKKAESTILPIYIYPRLKPFRKNHIFIGDEIKYDKLEIYRDKQEANEYIQSEILSYAPNAK